MKATARAIGCPITMFSCSGKPQTASRRGRGNHLYTLYATGHYEGLVGEPANQPDNDSMDSKGEGSDRKGGARPRSGRAEGVSENAI